MARALTLVRGLIARRRIAIATPPRRDRNSRQRSARLAVWSGFIAFALATLGLAGALESVRPEWRDPEYVHREYQLRAWKAKSPDRPLVLCFGSSRTQMGISPAAMGFPDEPGSPLVYNFGYRAAQPIRAWLQLLRVLDSGIKPDFVLIQMSLFEIGAPGNGEEQLLAFAPRLSLSDFNRMAPYTESTRTLWRKWTSARLTPWITYRDTVMDELLPDWQTPTQRLAFSWNAMDEYGFAPHHQTDLTPEQRARAVAHARKVHARGLSGRQASDMVMRTFRDLVERCRSEGIEVAFFWAPESPTYRSWFTPAARTEVLAFEQRLRAELHVPVFPAPDDLTDTDFVDGFHLMRHGAAKYSRWLAETQLRPWLAIHKR